ncbi:putative beta-sarcoglycan, partial [Operophtera brumata]
MLGTLRGVSPASDAAMSDDTLERKRAEKALITKTPTHSQYKAGIKNYSDKNGNDVTKAVYKGRKTFALWTLVCLESMEFLPEHNAIKFFGDADLDHVYKRDGLIESFRDEPMSISIDEDLVIHSDSSTFLRGAEGTHMESKELSWTADQDIHIRSINGSVVLSGKEGVYIDVRYLPIAMPISKAGTQATGQFKVCVCMPQGKLFRIAVPTGQK